MKKPPQAPPVYRPQLNAAQAKAAANARQKVGTPAAPPVYRPQPSPRVLQGKIALPNQSRSMSLPQPIVSRRPVEPPLRPNMAAPVNQTKPPHLNAHSQKTAPALVRPAGSIQRQIAGRSLQTGPPKPVRPLVQMKPNAAIAPNRYNTIQRRLRVTNIDYDPVANQYRHGTIDGADQASFVAALKAEFNGVARYAGFRGHLNTVMNAVVATANAGGGIQATDVPTLATAIATEVINEYGNVGQGAAMGALRNHLEEAITRFLVTRFQVAHGLGMNAHEQGAYDQLRAIVTDAHMSRTKGTASVLNHAQLPAATQTGVDMVLGDIRTERTLWRNRGRRLNIKYFLPAPNEEFSVEIIQRQRGKRYQGNHTNNAGWLPAAAAAPVNVVETAQANILAAASPGLTAVLNAHGNVLATLQVSQAGQAPTPLGVEFLGLVHAERQNLNRQNLADSVGAALAQGVSSFVEFSMPGHMSRLVWDVATNNIYISAHYKWRLGFNPWFRIDNYPAI